MIGARITIDVSSISPSHFVCLYEVCINYGDNFSLKFNGTFLHFFCLFLHNNNYFHVLLLFYAAHCSNIN